MGREMRVEATFERSTADCCMEEILEDSYA